MSQPVRAARAAIVAGVLVMAYVVALYLVKTVPDWAVGMMGGPSRPIDRYGGLSLTFKPAPGTEAAFDAYIAERGQVARRENGLFVVEFPGLPESAARETVDLLKYGGLVMKEVVIAEYAREIGESADVTIEVDQWRPDDGGDLHTDTYLMSRSADALQAAVAGYQPPPGFELAYEWVEPDSYAKDARPYLRTYMVKSEVAIDGGMVASATSTYDQYSNRPIVLLDFTREGGDKFCELTGRIAGGKLATIAGGRIRSAPVINGRICGGRASITMGGSDSQRQDEEARALVAVLKTGAIPEGTIENQAWKPAADVAGPEWKARLLFGLIAGVALGFIAFAAVRLTKPTHRRPLRGEGGVPWRRVVVTALAPLVLLVGSNMSLPGLNDVELEHILHRGLDSGESVFALGLTPIVAGYLLVEIVALAWPRLRWRRHDPRGRIGLGRAVAVVSIALALLQGYFMASYFESLGRPFGGFGGFGGYAEIVAYHGIKLHVIYMVTLAAGTMVLAILAGMIREHGLGNGYAVVMATTIVFDTAEPYTREGYENAYHFVTLSTLVSAVAAIGLAVATRALLRWRVDGLRMPTCGVSPLSESGGIVAIIVMLASLGFGSALEVMTERMLALQASSLASMIILFASVPLWAWLFARPSLLVGVRYGAWVRALVLTLGVFAAAWYIGPVYALGVMLVTATLLDVLDDLRAHRQKLVPAGIVHQAQYVPMLERALDEVGIPAQFHASHVRTLYAFFGPWAPIIVLVPEGNAEEARRLVYATITKEHHAVVQAFSRDARPTPGRRLVPAWARTT